MKSKKKFKSKNLLYELMKKRQKVITKKNSSSPNIFTLAFLHAHHSSTFLCLLCSHFVCAIDLCDPSRAHRITSFLLIRAFFSRK